MLPALAEPLLETMPFPYKLNTNPVNIPHTYPKCYSLNSLVIFYLFTYSKLNIFRYQEAVGINGTEMNNLNAWLAERQLLNSSSSQKGKKVLSSISGCEFNYIPEPLTSKGIGCSTPHGP